MAHLFTKVNSDYGVQYHVQQHNGKRGIYFPQPCGSLKLVLIAPF